MTRDPHSSLDVAWVGLGAMGLGMASHLLKVGHRVTGYDVWQPSMDKFSARNGNTAQSPREAAMGKEFFFCMTASAAQAEAVLFDEKCGAVECR